MSKFLCFVAVAVCLVASASCRFEFLKRAMEQVQQVKRQSSSRLCLPSEFSLSATLESYSYYNSPGPYSSGPYENTDEGPSVEIVYSAREDKLFVRPSFGGRSLEAGVFTFGQDQIGVKFSSRDGCEYYDMFAFRDTFLTPFLYRGPICAPEAFSTSYGVNGTSVDGQPLNLFQVYAAALLMEGQEVMSGAVNVRALAVNGGYLPVEVEYVMVDASNESVQKQVIRLKNVQLRETADSGKFSSPC